MVVGAVSIDATIGVAHGEFVLDVEVHAGDHEVVAVLGPNGAGKTTLLRALGGLVAIDTGRIVVDGQVVDDPGANVFVPPERRGIGFVFQNYLLFPHLSALDNVAFGLRARRLPRRAARARAMSALTALGLAAKAEARPAQLSGGEAQRVALARAVAVEPAVLLLDEPLAALDASTRLDVRSALRAVFDQFHGTRILVTHDPVDALTLADRLVILEEGRVAQAGTTDEIVARPRSQYVADLVGVNLYRGRADGTVVHVDGVTLTTVDDLRGAVLAVVPPHAVVLHRERPAGSARNVWAGTVATIDHLGPRVRVRVAGALPIVAEVTPAAVAALALTEGGSVWAAVKATEIAVYPD